MKVNKDPKKGYFNPESDTMPHIPEPEPVGNLKSKGKKPVKWVDPASNSQQQ